MLMNVASPGDDFVAHGVGALIDFGVQTRRLCVRRACGADACQCECERCESLHKVRGQRVVPGSREYAHRSSRVPALLNGRRRHNIASMAALALFNRQ